MQKINLIGIIFGVVMLVGSLIFLNNKPELMYFVVVLSLIVIVLPSVVYLSLGVSSQRKKQEKFLEFIRDLTENVKSGTSVSKAVVYLSDRNYGVLSNALENFSKETKNVVISRSVVLIREAERAGGDIGKILESVLKSVTQAEVLRKEQKSSVFNLIVQGYIIFIIFIIISLVLQFYFIPKIGGVGFNDLISFNEVSARDVDLDSLSQPLFFMMIVQSFFAGLVIGKISEGSIRSGIKHSFVLVVLVLLISSVANLFF
jgi:flagellar protein FlaJ